MSVYYSHSPADTAAVAAEVADMLPEGGVIAFTGDLGAGKTAFTKGLAAALGYEGEVSSPTFAIVQEYVGGRLPIYHFDMYRVSGWDDLYSTGYFDYLDSGAILAVEWSENITAALPQRYLGVDISRGEAEQDRVITVQFIGGEGA
jgi:tRNA threonylcarbamoyladenosine biosynthesis protein TsaE